MGKARLARERDPIEVHPVMIAVSKARSLAWTLTQLGEESAPASLGANNLLAAISSDAPDPEGTRAWLHIAIADALDAELATIEAAFRKSLTPEQAHAQVIGGPTAVA
jgi:hypothetical protein